MGRFRPDAWLVYTPSMTYPDLFGWWQRPRRYVLYAADKGRPERLPRRLRPFFREAHRRSLLTADAVGVYRPRSAARLESLGVAPERIHVLPPMVAMPAGTISQAEARRSLDVPLDRPVVVCVSRFTGLKGDGRAGKTQGVLELVRSMAQIEHNALCVIVGDGEGRAEIEAERARLGLEDRVRLVGAVPNSDVHKYYAASDVFAYPYDLDRPWLSGLEAQASGRPVVTIRTGSAEATVDDRRTGLLAGDLDEFRAQLAGLLGSRERCRSMGEAARDYVAKHHSLEVRVQQLESMLGGDTAIHPDAPRSGVRL
jgi:glycosyltransferase involved in cell wall biosynthesis